MPSRSRAMLLALGLMLSGPAHGDASAGEPPRIRKPQPAPDTKPEILPLPPAVFDNKLAIGGNDVKARQIDTRLDVEVRVNGRGPYRFVVDSGADTSAVGLRVAHDLELPLGTPAILNGMTSRDIVDRVAATIGHDAVRGVHDRAGRRRCARGRRARRCRRAGNARRARGPGHARGPGRRPRARHRRHGGRSARTAAASSPRSTSSTSTSTSTSTCRRPAFPVV